jgi:DNA polymerase-1
VHTSYHQAVTTTGRLSSTDPNLQNIPTRTEEGRLIRKAFIAPKGYKIISADYSQIELRIVAHASGDPTLINAFHHGLDIHTATAAEVLGVPLNEVTPLQRRHAKAVNFGLMYGMSAFGLAKQLNIDRDTAQEYITIYFKRYPGVRAFMEKTRAHAHEHGFVTTMFGRRLYLRDINSKNHMLRRGAERAAINAPMQGTAADIIKRAMITMQAWLEKSQVPAHLIMQVHDELVFEVAEDHAAVLKPKIAEIMSQAATLDVPLIVDVGIGNNWDEAH